MNAGCLFPVKTFQQTSLKKRLFRAIAPRFYISHTKRAASLKSASNSSLTASASAYSSPTPKMEISGPEKKEQVYQYIVVMRHGDRLDNVDPLWITQSERPWDPPLHQQGKTRAFTIGQRLRQTLGAPINRVFVSPFLRCLQTASEAVRALCTVADPNNVSSDAVSVDLSKIKVSTLSPIYLSIYLYIYLLALRIMVNASIRKYSTVLMLVDELFMLFLLMYNWIQSKRSN